MNNFDTHKRLINFVKDSKMKLLFPIFLLLSLILGLYACDKVKVASEGWRVYLGDEARSHYSTLSQIDTINVSKLSVAWEFKTGDLNSEEGSEMQCNPIIVDNVLYATSPKLKLFALNATTGKQKWVFDPFADTSKTKIEINRNRGVVFWTDGIDKRIFYTAGSFLYSVNAESGRLNSSFGDSGRVGMHQGFVQNVDGLHVSSTSPGVIYKDILILGTTVAETNPAVPGDIRGYNIHTGEIVWEFHTIPHPGESGYETWENQNAWLYTGGANSWGGMSLDQKRGVVYAPTGSATFDFYGGFRKGQNLFSNCIIALNALTGERIWHYQTIHHDLWDRDLPAPPNLITIDFKGKKVDAVAQVTKTGFVFVLDRDTGEPIYPIEERAVPRGSLLEGEEVWPTQPMPDWPEPFVQQVFTLDNINNIVPEDSQEFIREKVTQLETGNMFLPPSEKGIIMFPGFDGGAEWGGAAWDPVTSMLYINASQVPWIMKMVKTRTESYSKQTTISQHGRLVYENTCMVCHGKDRNGDGDYPSLLGINKKYSEIEVMEIVNGGRRMMPSFEYLSQGDKKALVSYLMDLNNGGQPFISLNDMNKKNSFQTHPTMPYTMTGYYKLRTPEGYPGNEPPWGTLTALNLNNGRIEWQIPFGEYPELIEKGIPITGSENYGGAIVTENGLLFIAATPDKKFKAYNKYTGKKLWEAQLPAAGFATPSTYMVDGKQFIVIACGGGKLGTSSGDMYVAYSLE